MCAHQSPSERSAATQPRTLKEQLNIQRSRTAWNPQKAMRVSRREKLGGKDRIMVAKEGSVYDGGVEDSVYAAWAPLRGDYEEGGGAKNEGVRSREMWGLSIMRPEVGEHWR